LNGEPWKTGIPYIFWLQGSRVSCGAKFKRSGFRGAQERASEVSAAIIDFVRGLPN
jgi:hypothetical protein